MRRIIYLAAPYTDPDPAIRQERYERVTEAAMRLVEQDHIVFSPLTHSHPIEVLSSAIRPSDWWCDFDETFMAVCTEMAILPLPGWERSSGVARERAYFEERGRPVWIIEPESIA